MTTTNAAKFLKAIVFTLAIPGLRTTKQSKRGKEILAEQLAIDADEMGASKKLMTTSQIKKDIVTRGAAIRDHMTEQSCYVDAGRFWILPARMQSVIDYLTKATTEMTSLFEDMANAMPAILASEAIAKGSIFDPKDYESADKIREKKIVWSYDFQADKSAIASLFDCDEFAASIEAAFETQQEEKYQAIRAQLAERILDETTRIHAPNNTGAYPQKSAVQKIASYDPTRKGARIQCKSIVEQIRTAARLADLLLTDDYDIKTSCQKLARLAARTTNPESLKEPLFSSQWIKDCREAVETIQTDNAGQLQPAPIAPANNRESNGTNDNELQAQKQTTEPAIAPGFSLS